MDKYRIDSHKLQYHVGRVSRWLAGDDIYPLYMEISPAGACNHRCVFCGLDFMGYKPRFLDPAILKERLTELGELGLKSIMYAGEGEPFLHKSIVEIINHTKAAGIDVALTTNGVLFRAEIAERILGATEWIKVSCNAGRAGTYARIHRTREDDFARVFHNLARAVALKREHHYACTIGLQCLLLPENEDEIVELAAKCRDTGLDYLVVKPYSQHPQGASQVYENISYAKYPPLAERLAAMNSDAFHVVFRLHTMQKWDRQSRPYQKCLALPFWSYMDAGGNIWGCSVYLEDKRFLYGNIYQSTFREIWEGALRHQSLQWTDTGLDPADCRVNCRMDEINLYLWGLKNPPPHVNFI